MEAFIGLIFIIVGFNIVWRLFFAGARVATAGIKSVATGQSFDEAMGRIPPLATRVVEKNTEEDSSGLDYWAVEVRGLFPVSYTKDVTFTVSLLDATNGKKSQKPVLSILEHFQESNSRAYFCHAQIGNVNVGQGFVKWTEIGRIIPFFVQSSHAGDRNLTAIVRLLETDSVNKINLGYADLTDQELLWVNTHEIDLEQVAKGYEEAVEDRKECLTLSVSLAMSVAMADGSLDDSEGSVIKNWMNKALTTFPKNDQSEIKKVLNNAMKSAYSAGENDTLSKTNVVKRFNEIGDDRAKYEAMDLCYEVMAADGVADDEEIKVLHRLGDALELEISELDKIRDLKMMDLSGSLKSDEKSLLGIDPDWSNEEIKNHLKSEFKKWNARLNNLQSGPDREHAQKMLDLIGRERSKHGE
tara:strand:- start:249 stop:1487 length:1239 start_codon:yes stop_codon:yes gene_type:complete